MKITCRCGSTTMDFPYLTKEDFPDGWETSCCHIKPNEKPLVKSDEPPRSTVEQWLKSSWLINTNREGVWVPSMDCFHHYVAWMKRKGLGQAETLNNFGRLMRKLCSSRRRNSGKYYLLDKVPI